MPIRIHLWLLAILLLPGCTAALDPDPLASNVCETVADPTPWKFCVSRTADADESHILYFFHGAGMSEKTWAEPGHVGHAVRQEWLKSGNPNPPVVISISFGETWFATQGSPAVGADGLQYGLLTLLTDRVIPHVEQKALSQPVKERSLFGFSMGGYTAGRLAFGSEYTWSRVTLLCPALEMPMRADGESNAQLAKRLNAKPRFLKRMLQMSETILQGGGTPQSFSVLELAKYNRPASQSYFISTGLTDEYGFFGPSKSLHDILSAKPSVHSVFRPEPGGHCSIDARPLAKFLLDGSN